MKSTSIIFTFLVAGFASAVVAGDQNTPGALDKRIVNNPGAKAPGGGAKPKVQRCEKSSDCPQGLQCLNAAGGPASLVGGSCQQPRQKKQPKPNALAQGSKEQKQQTGPKAQNDLDKDIAQAGKDIFGL
ncbi:hypothetical protein HIM_12143 [Hirsutella minnesotensis 3608]|uniref:Uncharacterized protein n=1 Tax=Hirsutella minnesotensis 3608 TaxID=1043627 RepID=A0A0F7ZW72_9HYPO|nr:hypothetical protein HIM_12143 [Hirsutella minnesotensis 3608]